MWTLDEVVEKLLPKVGEILKDNLHITVTAMDDAHVSRHTFDAVDAALAEARGEIERLQGDLTAARGAIDHAKCEDYFNRVMSGKNEKIRLLERSLSDMTADRDSYQQRRGGLQQRLTDLERRHDGVKTRLRELAAEKANPDVRTRRPQRIVDHVLVYSAADAEWVRGVLTGER